MIPGWAWALPALLPDQLEDLLKRRRGFKARAEETDARVLAQRAAAGDREAELALTIFARSIAKTIAGYATVLDGLDLLVFTGGIGQHSAPVRRAVCDRLACLGLRLEASNETCTAPATVSSPSSQVRVLVQETDEDGQIALHVGRLLRA